MGPLEDTDDVDIIGPFGFGTRCMRAQRFINMCTALRLTIQNSYVNESGGNWTCAHWGISEPTQLDYVAADVPPKYNPRCRLKDSAATESDHTIVALTFDGKYNKFRRRKHKGISKPIHWKLTTDIDIYNSNIRSCLGLPESHIGRDQV